MYEEKKTHVIILALTLRVSEGHGSEGAISLNTKLNESWLQLPTAVEFTRAQFPRAELREE